MAKRYILMGGTYKFEPSGGPIDSPQEFATLLQAIGLAITAWARMEHLLLAIAIHVNKKAASEALHDKNPSAAFSRISKLLQRWLVSHPPYQALAQGLGPEFFDNLREMADMRNHLAHGHLREYDPQSGAFAIGTIKRKDKDTWTCRTTRYEWKALEALASLSNVANHELIKLADRLFEPTNAALPERP